MNPILPPRVLARVGWKFLQAHRWLLFLMVTGIALGVGVVVAVDIANLSAQKAFELSSEAIAGKATHQITSGPQGLDEKVYFQLKREGLAVPSAPLISEFVTSPQLGERAITLLGIDPFSDGQFRGYMDQGGALQLAELTAFFTRPGALIISKELAERYVLKPGDKIAIEAGGKTRQGFISGIVEPADAISRRALEGTILADISTAQELTGKIGKISQIDLILSGDQPEMAASIQSRLPAGALLEPAALRTNSLDEMTSAFRLNLSALSMLALLVGLFLIYNSMTFAVIERRELFGILRCLGVTRKEIILMVIGEAALVGFIGSLLGVGLGVIFGRNTVGMVTQTINDLYYTTTITSLPIPWESLAKGMLVGVLATVFAAIAPAWEAGSVSPRLALQRANLEGKTRRILAWTGWVGFGLIVAGTGLFLIPNAGIYIGFGGTFLVVIGFAFFSAWVMALFMQGAALAGGRIFGFIGKMAPRNLSNALSRTSVAVAALMIAVAVTIGVDLMIASFRNTVVQWMGQTLGSDVYISTPGFSATTPTIPIDTDIIQLASSFPGVQQADYLRAVTVQSPAGPVNLFATNNPNLGTEKMFHEIGGTSNEVWTKMQNGGVIISEPLSNRLNLHSGDSIRLFTAGGWQEFPVAGVYFDYGNSSGIAMMDLQVYRKLWKDAGITSIGLRLAPGEDAEVVTRNLQDATAGRQNVIIRPNLVLRQEVMAVFDRTFAITTALRFLSTGVAFAGILSALMMLQLEKARETGILRALGLTNGQLATLIFLETSLMGFIAGLLAMPTGYALALILVYVINLRSFGWTIQMVVSPQAFIQAMIISLSAAILAGIYPAIRLMRASAVENLRMD
jgi:putative ABC transport system permease protein